MHHSTISRLRVLALMLCLVALVQVTRGQEQSRTPQETGDEIVRINTELVQTNVMVFDSRGRFVDGLKPEQFELRVEEQLVPIAFFERVVAGSANESAQLSALNRGATTPAESATNEVQKRGRIVIFFIDDLHLSLDSLSRTRAAISHFIEHEMSATDRAAIASASGQIGFLQQLTDNKAVLRAALAKLKHIAYRVQDTEQPTMSEYMALKIEQRDRDAAGYYVERCLHEMPRYTPAKCVEVVKDRARGIIQQASAVTANTLTALENLMRSSGQLHGRKLVMLISDGFYLGALHLYGNVLDKLPQITDEARRHGVVIYTIDARGLISGQPDATVNLVDANGLLDRANLGEIPASQDALHALAGDTGGRALRNSNSITDWVTDTLKETSNYYLLAWRPNQAEQRTSKFKRLSVKIVGHPEWTARLPRGYLESIQTSDAADAKGSKPSSKPDTRDKALPPVEASLRSALGATYPQQALSTLLSITFLDTPQNGIVLTASTQIAASALSYGTDGHEAAAVDLAGVILNTDGKPAATFRTKLNVNQLPENQNGADQSGVIYNYRSSLAPGLYQVRVAARDEHSGRTGSAMQWVEIPDLKTKALSLSSLLIGVQPVGETQKVSETQTSAAPQVQFSVSRRFKRTSRLGFLVFIYNTEQAASDGSTTNLTCRVQVFDNQGRAVVETPARPMTTAVINDAARIPYAGTFPLQALQPNQYVLRITVRDTARKTSAVQETSFIVE